MDTNTSALASIGIDIGKEVFHIVGFGTNGKIAFRRKIKRLADSSAALNRETAASSPKRGWAAPRQPPRGRWVFVLYSSASRTRWPARPENLETVRRGFNLRCKHQA